MGNERCEVNTGLELPWRLNEQAERIRALRGMLLPVNEKMSALLDEAAKKIAELDEELSYARSRYGDKADGCPFCEQFDFSRVRAGCKPQIGPFLEFIRPGKPGKVESREQFNYCPVCGKPRKEGLYRREAEVDEEQEAVQSED